MKRLIKYTTAALTISTLGLSGAALALTPSSSMCASLPTVTVAPNSAKTLTVNNKNITVGANSSVRVNGNGNCVNGTSDSLKVTGNNNFVTASGSSVRLVGSNNFFESQGGNYVDCGGSKASTDEMTDATRHCVST